VGTSEHLHLECKTWPANENEAQKGVAKAVCGFANSDGGVLIIGLSTKTCSDKYVPDVIDGTAPIPNIAGVKSRIDGLIPELVEPPVNGVTVAAVSDAAGATSGFVLIDVPPTDGPPCRSRKDWRLYQRINSGTYLMEYFQIEAMFGKRLRPVLALHLEFGTFRLDGQIYEREFTIGIENRGRGIARFPSIRFQSIPGINLDFYGIDGNRGFGLPRRPTEPEVLVFGGGADDVIYPGTVLKVAKLTQRARGKDWKPTQGGRQQFYLEEYTFTAEVAADGVQGIEQSRTLPRLEIPL
jgi:hypothetical protein